LVEKARGEWRADYLLRKLRLLIMNKTSRENADLIGITLVYAKVEAAAAFFLQERDGLFVFQREIAKCDVVRGETLLWNVSNATVGVMLGTE
jgi:hypothetical protein